MNLPVIYLQLAVLARMHLSSATTANVFPINGTVIVTTTAKMVSDEPSNCSKFGIHY